MEPSVCRLLSELSAICTERPLEEKWLLAPSRRVGQQWLDAMVLADSPAVNVRVKTVKNLALELASGLLAGKVRLASPMEAALLVAELWQNLPADADAAYLRKLQPTLRLFEQLHGSILELRLAGIDGEGAPGDGFEAPAKGREIFSLLRGYRKELQARKLVDYADILTMAASALSTSKGAQSGSKGSQTVPGEAIILLPDGLDCSHMEQSMLAALPRQRLVRLPADAMAADGETADPLAADLHLLRWFHQPASAPPPPRGDGSADIFRAVGEVNEVREVFRRVLAEGLRLDEVEILYSDADAYLPLVYEIAERHRRDDGPTPAGISATFADGIPVRYFRPGRALMGFLDWLSADCPQDLLVRMLQDGLLQLPQQADELSHLRFSGVLRTLGVGFGRQRYLPAVADQIAAAEAQWNRPPDSSGEDELSPAVRAQRLEARLAGLRAVRVFLSGLMDCLPPSHATQAELFLSARRFLAGIARSVNKEDNLCRDALLDRIDEMARLAQDGDVPGLDGWDWLRALAAQVRIGGTLPLPGHVHVASLASGGHSGRRRTFVLGLDDGRFPGSGLLDPILLDGERTRVSPVLPVRADRLRRKIDNFALLLARLRGHVTLSFSCRSLDDEREQFPSPALLTAHRILSGRHEDDQTAMLASLKAAASFAPDAALGCLDESEWWMWRTCGPSPRAASAEVLAAAYGNLGGGLAAMAARAGDQFTAFDGRVEQAGADHDPAAPDGPVFSAGRLETIGACPLRYFFKYILAIEPQEDLAIDEKTWLDPLQFGSLLHDVFHDFMAELIRDGAKPDYDRHIGRLRDLLGVAVESYKKFSPPPNEAAYRLQRRHLEQACHIFLKEEQVFCRRSQPLYVEAALGMPGVGDGTAIDQPDPVRLQFGPRTFRARGRIDRIDRDADGRYVIIDYKTGRSTRKYEEDRPFDHGRTVQHAMYCKMLRGVLASRGEAGDVAAFQYFFPGHVACGKRIFYRPAELEEGETVIANLLQVAASGCFLASELYKSETQNDCRHCDYAPICAGAGGLEAVCTASRRKLNASADAILSAYRELRPQEAEK